MDIGAPALAVALPPLLAHHCGMRKLAIASGVAGAAALAFFFVLPRAFDAVVNGVTGAGRHPISARARAIFASARVVDLHADSLLWGRDLLSRGSRGAVDLPRLLEGNVALQAFTLVTTTPRIMHLRGNRDETDNIALLTFVQRWPAEARRSPFTRALYQARQLDLLAERSDGAFTVIRSRRDLAAFLSRRVPGVRLAAGFLGCEGAQALEGDLARLDALYAAGIRMMAPTHFTDTAIASSAHGVLGQGLTPLGRQWVRQMEEKHMLIDLAHASHDTIAEVLALARGPVVVSHTGVRGTCDNDRNLTDDELRGVARTGGVVGIAYFKVAVCDATPVGIARAIRHAANVAGVEHVALGSDFDGAVKTPFDATGLIQLVDPLLKQGFTEEQIRLILGENTLRVLGDVLE
jgi:microsomal dipeptidase-like Zn-dependent dipeptidase